MDPLASRAEDPSSNVSEINAENKESSTVSATEA
jgi:hypothetical protein